MVINKDVSQATRLQVREGQIVTSSNGFHQGRVEADEVDGKVSVLWDGEFTETVAVSALDLHTAPA